jgi:hypothetical protein
MSAPTSAYTAATPDYWMGHRKEEAAEFLESGHADDRHKLCAFLAR